MTPSAKNGEVGARLDAADQDGRGLSGADVAGELDRDLAWSRIAAAIGAADRVEDGALGEPHHIIGEILIFQVRRIAGKPLRERRLAARGSRGSFLLRGDGKRRRAHCQTSHCFQETATRVVRGMAGRHRDYPHPAAMPPSTVKITPDV
jgi:hypothetical protein